MSKWRQTVRYRQTPALIICPSLNQHHLLCFGIISGFETVDVHATGKVMGFEG